MIRDRWLFGRKCRRFTLQWHLTNLCNAHCKHCYDRSKREQPSLRQALAILEDLKTFCRGANVAPQLSLSGGDPLLYSHFWELYEAIAHANIPVSILGNPISPDSIEHLLRLRPPTYYQVSLEGLSEHNDFMRGPGHFERIRDFLLEARKQGLNTHVMLTLTRANLDQVLPLGEELRGLTSRFTFNRLSQVGEAVDLEAPTKAEFVEFLRGYLAATRTNPVLGLKDNFFNIFRHHSKRPLMGGCTGFGCGAGFNFVALLPDGEVHACRKYPSLLGNIHQASLSEIYGSPQALRYRNGSTACGSCKLRNHCGGCPAVTHGRGLDPLSQRDPYCFLDEAARP
jgi:selenobiotic family peptide radical SAM maturase